VEGWFGWICFRDVLGETDKIKKCGNRAIEHPKVWKLNVSHPVSSWAILRSIWVTKNQLSTFFTNWWLVEWPNFMVKCHFSDWFWHISHVLSPLKNYLALGMPCNLF
jgi:hypothetical protein